jgi:hypothetical protein
MDRLYANEPYLRLIVTTNPLQRKHLIITGTKDQIDSIAEIALNIANKNFALSPSEKAALRPYKTPLLKLIDRRLPLRRRKQIIVQQSGGFLPALLAPVIGTIFGLAVEKIFGR